MGALILSLRCQCHALLVILSVEDSANRPSRIEEQAHQISGRCKQLEKSTAIEKKISDYS